MMKMERATSTHVEMIEFTPDEAKAWGIPVFQRPVNVNAKVRALSEEIKTNGGVLPGVICFGLLDKQKFLIDGQQRREAFLLSGIEKGYADARFGKYKTLAEMAREFVHQNSHLVNMKPDDILKGLECALEPLHELRDRCPFVGYDSIRRNDHSPILSMSMVLRSWELSRPEVPGRGTSSSQNLAEQLTAEDSRQLGDFLLLAFQAWGRDPEYHRLWASLNLVLCMWLYRRIVLSAYSTRTNKITEAQFKNCLMGLSANSLYQDWLTGRRLGDRDRSPALARIKLVFSQRLQQDTGKKPSLPSPAWAHC